MPNDPPKIDPNTCKMLFLQFLCFIMIPAVFAKLVRQQQTGGPPQLSPTDPCSQNCSSTYDLLIRCAMSEDSTCGCGQYANVSARCMQCLQTTNSSIAGGVFDYDYLRSTIAGCSCQTPACQPIGFLVHFCLFADPLSVACTCPAFTAYGAQCSQCLRGVDPYVADLYDTQYIPGCQLFEGYVANITSNSPSSCVPSTPSSSPSGSGVPTPSSTIAVFTGESSIVKFNFLCGLLIIFVGVAII